MKRWMVVLASLILVGFAFQVKGVTWSIEKVTNNAEEDSLSFITTDERGVHIVYTHDDGDMEVFYATNATGAWQNHRVTDNTRNDLGWDISARGDNIHIAIGWEDTPDNEISYCKGSPGAWNIERVTDDADDDGTPTMVIDKNGYAHMAYMKMTGGDLEIFYANNVTGSWVEEQVTDNSDQDGYTSLVLDNSGNPHIAFIRVAPGPIINIFYIKKLAGVWHEEKTTNVPGGMIATFPVLMLDNMDFAHLTYAKSDGTDYEIYYTNNVLGSWQESKVTSNDFNDVYPTLTLDHHNKAHIAYLAMEPAADVEVFYANNTAGVWNIGRVTDNSVHDIALFGRWFSLDDIGFGHITFWNNEDGDNEIYYARSNEPLFTGIEEKDVISSRTLMRIHPNPFKKFSVISFQLPVKSRISLEIYDATGRLVRTLTKIQNLKPGAYTEIWNGKDDTGKRVPSGLYFYKLTTGGFSIIQKGILE